MKQNSDNHYNDNYSVKLPFISKAQAWHLSAKLLLKLAGKKKKSPLAICVTENILTEKVLSSWSIVAI